MLLNSHISAYARCLAGKVCGLVRSTWGTSQGEDKPGARDRILNTKAARRACAGQTFPHIQGHLRCTGSFWALMAVVNRSTLDPHRASPLTHLRLCAWAPGTTNLQPEQRYVRNRLTCGTPGTFHEWQCGRNVWNGSTPPGYCVVWRTLDPRGVGGRGLAQRQEQGV